MGSDAADGGTYDLNVGRWIADHPGWQIRGAFEGFGYETRPSTGGRWIFGTSLDELAARVADAQQPEQPAS
jgi:hypothetical protein